MNSLESKRTRSEGGKACACGGACKDRRPKEGAQRGDPRAAGNMAVQRRTRMGESASAGDGGVLAPAQAQAPAPAPAGGMTINVTQPGTELTRIGAAWYQVHWNAPANSNGWIVQHIDFSNYVTQADGTLVNGNNTPVEYWEAWEVQNGRVFVGPASGGGIHVADTFRTVSEGTGKRGVVTIFGHVEFIPGYTLNTPPWGNTVPEARSLPSMRSAPPGWSDSGTLPHWMTVQFNCTDPDAANHTQTVTTNP